MGALVFTGYLLLTTVALADAPPDTVFLVNGGRLVGSVVTEDPERGVTIKLLDGTIRTVKREDVKTVQYGATTAAAAPPNSATQTESRPILLAPVAPAPELQVRNNPGLFVAGLVLTIVGGASTLAGGVTLAAGFAQDDECNSEAEGTCIAGGTLLGLGIASIGAGIPMMIVGGRRVPARAAWWRPSDVALSPVGGRITWSF